MKNMFGTQTKTDFLDQMATFDKLPIEIGRVTNTRWAQLTKENQKISLEALEAFNKALSQSVIFPSTLQS